MKKICIHNWEYVSGGKFDTIMAWGSRYRICTKCKKKQIFDDFSFSYQSMK